MAGARERARSFGVLAEQYERTRPSYPEQAITASLPAGAARVVDVGAGTGKLTAVLVRLGLEVVAVEPDPQMAEVLARLLPGVDLRAGSAEALPLSEGDYDAVFFGQSWHWTDPVVAGEEAARVLRPGGALVLLWNVTDDTTPWVRRLRDLTGTEARLSDFEPPEPPVGFCRGHRQDTVTTERTSVAGLLELVSTWSTVSILPRPEREEVTAKVGRMLTSELSLADDGEVELPLVTVACWFHRA